MFRTLRILGIVCLLGLASVAEAREGSVQLKSGNVLTGEILEIGEKTIRLRIGGEDGFVMDLDTAKVARVYRNGKRIELPGKADKTPEPSAPAKPGPGTTTHRPPPPESAGDAAAALSAKDRETLNAFVRQLVSGKGRYESKAAFLKAKPEYADWKTIEKPPVIIFHDYDAIRREGLIDRIHARASAMAKMLRPDDSDSLLSTPVIIIAPRSSNAYNQGGRGFKAAGLYDPALDAIMANFAMADMWKTVRHEMTHMMFQRAVGMGVHIPDSLNEGLAVYEETYGLDADPAEHRDNNLETDMTLAAFLRMDLKDREGMSVSAFYRLALAMTKMFCTRGSVDTYVGFAREVSLVRRLPDDTWHDDAAPRLLKHYYNFNSLEEAERAFRTSLK